MSDRGGETPIGGEAAQPYATLRTTEIRERMNGISSSANIAAIQGVDLPPEVMAEYAALAAELERRAALCWDEE
jgi:hypothetical protein